MMICDLCWQEAGRDMKKIESNSQAWAYWKVEFELIDLPQPRRLPSAPITVKRMVCKKHFDQLMADINAKA